MDFDFEDRYHDCLLVGCTADRQIVFAIRNNLPSVYLDTTKLYIFDHPECKPVFVNNKVAIFKFGVDECGVRSSVSRFSFPTSLLYR